MTEDFDDFNKFYVHYLSAHSHPACLGLHFFGTTFFFASIIATIFTLLWYLIPIAIVVGYLSAWTGHYVFEKNKPTTFTRPGWSGRAGRLMYYQILTGRLKIFRPTAK